MTEILLLFGLQNNVLMESPYIIAKLSPASAKCIEVEFVDVSTVSYTIGDVYTLQKFFSSINSKIFKILKNFLIPARVNILSYIGSGKHDNYLGFIYLKRKDQKLPKVDLNFHNSWCYKQES